MTNSRQALFLREMGYMLWQRRLPGQRAVPMDDRLASVVNKGMKQGDEETEQASHACAIDVLGQAPNPTLLPSSRLQAVIKPVESDRATLDGTNEARAAAIARMNWEALTDAIRACRACGLCQHRKQAVPGVGDRAAAWLFIGEGPGAEEDTRGEPFVGQAGRLLDAMLASIDLKRGENVYIANAVKCRPEGNRTPTPAEMATCRPFLLRQIALLQPALIVLLGKAAVHSVLGEDRALAGLRKTPRYLAETPVIVTYHPAYLLRNLPEKAKSWEDLCLARRIWRERCAADYADRQA
jgi:DNA polymerase